MSRDIVFPVKQGEWNEELRYALRSLQNIPHGRVWIVGHKPTWVDNVGFIHVQQNGTKHQNSLKNLLAACRSRDVAEEFILWNDDMFLLERFDEIPVMHRGTIQQYMAKYCNNRTLSVYLRGMVTTRDILQRLGFEEPLCYELHMPFPMTKSGLLEAHAKATADGLPKTRAIQMKSVYGNYFGLGGEQGTDVKIHKLSDPWVPGPFMSTIDKIWSHHPATKHVIELFDEPSPYERTKK